MFLRVGTKKNKSQLPSIPTTDEMTFFVVTQVGKIVHPNDVVTIHPCIVLHHHSKRLHHNHVWATFKDPKNAYELY